MTIAQDLPIVQLADRGAWERWLETNHSSSRGVWLKIAKKGSGAATVTYAEALEAALCHGWIDGQKRAFDERFWLQRFTPRGPRSKWSGINRDKATELIAGERMRPSGLARVTRPASTAAGTPPTRGRAEPPSLPTSGRRSMRILRRRPSSRRSPAPTATAFCTASRTPSAPRPERGGSSSSWRCSPSTGRSTDPRRPTRRSRRGTGDRWAAGRLRLSPRLLPDI